MSQQQPIDMTDTDDSKGKESSHRIRRRNRMITSCLECRRRKLKCDKLHPCTNCTKFSRDCMFLAPALDSVSQKKLNEIKDRMGSLEKVLENDLARRKSETSKGRKSSATDLPGEDSHSENEALVPDDEKPLEHTPMAFMDAAFEDSASEDYYDLGVRIGKMRLTERLGGMFRPRISEELAFTLGEPINKDIKDPSILRLRDDPDFLAPGPNFIPPGSGFVFGDVGPRRNLLDFLPTQAAADVLIQHYHQRANTVAKVLHWPSFLLQYENFWTNVLAGIEPSASLQALVFSVLFSAVACMGELEVQNVFGERHRPVLVNFQTATEVAFGKAQLLRTTRIDTLQALVIYLIPMCRDELSRAHSVLVGTAIRLAECLGLHRDPEVVFGMPPIETHIRRILWFQLCFLDWRTAEVQGPRPTIKRDDYDTHFPSNLDDTDLMIPNTKEKEIEWTDMTLTRMRFECCEIWRVISVDNMRLQQNKTSITHVLGKIESFRKGMEAKYHPFLNESIPIQRYAKTMLAISTSRLHVAVLHRYHNSVTTPIPDRLRQILLTSGTKCLEDMISLYTNPEYGDLLWYTPALMGWHTAALLCLEIFLFPQRQEADRIWAILDYVFGPDTNLSRDKKARQIIATMRDRAAIYRDLRGMRQPVSMRNRLATKLPVRNLTFDGPEMVLPKAKQQTEPSPPTTQQQPRRQSQSTSVRSDSASRSEHETQPQSQSQSQPQGQLQPQQQSRPQPTSNSWTFDSFSTLFVAPRSDISNRTNSVASVGSPASPNATGSSPLPGARAQLPGLDYGSSPSNSSALNETWPPHVLNEQHGWRIAVSPPTPQAEQQQQQRQQSQPYSQAIPQNLQSYRNINSSTNPLDNPLSVGQMSNLYLSQGSQLPFMSGAFDMSGTTGGVGAGGSIQSSLPMNSSEIQHQQPPAAPIGAGMGQNQQQADDMMALDIDWTEWDKIFPPDINTGKLDQVDYRPQ